jgi:hypothetical protein
MSEVEMCKYYEWVWLDSPTQGGKPFCWCGRKASIKCHGERTDCPDYEEAEYYDEDNT